MLAFCDRRQKKSPRDCADQFTKVIIKTTTFFHDGFKTILKEKSQFPENKANTIGIRIEKKKKAEFLHIMHCSEYFSFFDKKNYARPTNACMQNANVRDLDIYIILYGNIQYAHYTIFYLSVCSTPL